MANPVGRPTKHSPYLVQQALEYIRDYDNPYYLPSIAEMCRKVGISRTQFYEWKKRSDRDTDTIEKALRARLDELEPPFFKAIEKRNQAREERERREMFKGKTLNVVFPGTIIRIKS